MATGELACSYATVILHDENIPVTAEKIDLLVKAANLKVESYWPTLFSKLADKMDVGDLLMNVGTGGGAAPAAIASTAASAPAATSPAVEEKKEEPKEDSDGDMGFNLFD